MQSLCVCYYDAEVFANYSEADFARMGAICAPHDEALRLSGKVSLVGSLGMPNDFKTLRADKKGVPWKTAPTRRRRIPSAPSTSSRLATSTRPSRSRARDRIWATCAPAASKFGR